MLSVKQVIGMVGVVGLSAAGALAQSWVPFGEFNEGAVWDLHVHNGELYLAGRNGNVGTGLGAFVRRWNGTEWVWVGNQLLVEQPGAVATQLASHHGELYVVGLFDDGLLRQAAKWDGNTWQQVGDGLGVFGRYIESFDGRLWAIAVPNARSQSQLKILQGSQWVDPPSGPMVGANWIGIVDGTLHLGTYSGELLRYENGSFTSLGVVEQGMPVGPVARFNDRLHAGVSISPSGFRPVLSTTLAINTDGGWKRSIATSFLADGSFVSSMQVYNGELYQFGQQLSAFTLPVPGDTVFRSVTRWCPGMRGVPNTQFSTVRSSIIWQGRLVVGVEYLDGNDSLGRSVWELSPRQDPVISNTVQDVALACDGSARSIQLVTPTPTNPLIFREDVVTGGVEWILPSAITTTSSQLTVSLPATQNGRFRYILTDGSGSAETNAFSVRSIDIDFNNNSVFPEDQDVIDFLNALSGGVCAGTSIRPCDSIDINANGVYPEDADVIAFFTNLAGGCE